MQKLFFFIILFFITSSLKAEIVKDVQVNGQKRVSDQTILVYGDVEFNKNYEKQDIDELIKKLYSTNFFENIEVKIENNTLIINVKEFDIINSIIVEGEKTQNIKNEILKRINLKEKSSFIESLVIEDENIIKKLYQQIGYNFTEVSSKIAKFDNERVNLYFFIDKKEKTKIQSINFIGDKKFRDSKLRDIIVSEEHKFWKFISNNVYLNLENVELDKRLLLNYYKSIGYYDAQVISNFTEISIDGYTTLTYNINSGNRYRISKISTNLDNSLSKEYFSDLQNIYKDYIGKYYSPFSVKKILDEVDRIILDKDLQFIQHSVSEELSGDNIEIKLNIFEGQKILVERINITGNRITNEDVIRSELLIDEGDPFNPTNLAKSVANLKARNIFAKVEEKVEDGSKNDLKIINLEIEEKATGEISAGAGVGTSGGALDFSIKENNWLGKGLSIETSFAIRENSFKGAFEVNDPNYKFTGNNRFYRISSTTNDAKDSGYENSIIELGAGIGYEQFKNVYFSPSIFFTSDKLDVDSTASANLKKQEGTFNDLIFNYKFTYDERDRTYLPTDGFISSFEQSLPIYADAPSIKNTFFRNNYYSLGENFVSSVKVYASAISGLGEDVRLSKRINLPSSRLRGFEYGKIGPKDGGDFIGGNYAAALNLETSLPNFFPENTNLDLNLFLDFANLWGVDYDSALAKSNKIRSSTGVAIDFRSPIGPMSFVIAQDLQKADTDVTEFFNFRLGTTF